jgi:creatinine amidohydrolase
LVDVMARDLRAEFGLRTFTLFGSGGAAFEGLSPQEAAYGFHAGELETALILSAAPELVHTDRYTANYIADIEKPEVLKPEFSGANFAWLTRDIAESGVMGDPRPATAENGDKWAAAAAVKVAEALTAMYRYEKRFRP